MAFASERHLNWGKLLASSKFLHIKGVEYIGLYDQVLSEQHPCSELRHPLSGISTIHRKRCLMFLTIVHLAQCEFKKFPQYFQIRRYFLTDKRILCEYQPFSLAWDPYNFDSRIRDFVQAAASVLWDKIRRVEQINRIAQWVKNSTSSKIIFSVHWITHGNVNAYSK